jgi:hypothetical protein
MTVPRNWWNYQNIPEDKRDESLTLFLKDVYTILNKGITPTDNFRGAAVSVTFSALNTDTYVEHGLAFVPSNYFVIGRSADIRVYDGSSSNDGKLAYFRAAGTTGTVRMFLF